MDVEYYFEKYYDGEKNFMTPHVYGYDSKRFGKYILLFEKSKGKGLFDNDLYGCSCLVYNTNEGNVQKIDIGGAFSNMEEVDVYINSITKRMVYNSSKYGEIKIL